MKTNNDIEELIAVYLKGEATPEQAMQLDDWRAISQENDSFYFEMEKTYGFTHKVSVFKSPNVEKVWKEVATKVNDEVKTIPLWKTPPFYYLTAACAVIFLLINGLWNNMNEQTKEFNDKIITEQSDKPTKSRKILASDFIKSFTLKDQSKVELEPGSELIISADFNKNGRHLKMKGSGTFKVTHDENNPFSINIEGLNVLDIGTLFHLKTQRDTIKVTVDEGAVELRVNEKTLQLLEGDSAFYVISQQLIARYKNPRTVKKQLFEFDGTTLKEVATVLGKFYNRKIVIMDKEIENCTVNVTFKNEELATILDIIKELLDVKIVQNKDIIEIYGKGCL